MAGQSARAPISLSELEYALRITGEKRDFCRLPEIEIFETREAFAHRSERVVRAEHNAMPCIAAHVIDQLAGIAGDLVGRRIVQAGMECATSQQNLSRRLSTLLSRQDDPASRYQSGEIRDCHDGESEQS